MAVLDFDAGRWRAALGWSSTDIPDLLVLEGTWWREVATGNRLSHLSDVRETAFPDIFTGRAPSGARVAYCCAYGAARAAEVTHVCAQVGTPLVVQIGTCGALQPGIGTGCVAVPRSALAQDGVTPTYGGGAEVPLDSVWTERAAGLIAGRGLTVTQGTHLTWTTLFAQSDELCATWAAQGIATVDMETAAVATVARRFGAGTVALLAAWDLLGEGRTFLDPVDPAEASALSQANAATWETALALAARVASERRGGQMDGAAA